MMDETLLELKDFLIDGKGNLYHFFLSKETAELDRWRAEIQKGIDNSEYDSELEDLGLLAYVMEKSRGKEEIVETVEDLGRALEFVKGMCILARLEKRGKINVIDESKYFNTGDTLEIILNGISEEEFYRLLRAA